MRINSMQMLAVIVKGSLKANKLDANVSRDCQGNLNANKLDADVSRDLFRGT